MRNIVLFLFILLAFGSVKAQINKPKSSVPTSNPQISPTEEVRSVSNPDLVDVRTVNGIELKLIKVEGNATEQSVTFHFLFTNPKANTRVSISQAYGLDLEGEEYKDANDYYDVFTLYTDAPKKVIRTIGKVPSKVKSFRFVKFVIGKDGADEALAEYRNIKIDWK